VKTVTAKVAGAALVLLLLVAIAILGNWIFTRERLGPAGTEAVGDEPPGVEIRTMTLYFGSPDSVALTAERRDVPAGSNLSANVAAMFEDLAQGPMSEAIEVLPRGTRVRHVFVDKEGTAYVDFSREIMSGLGGGLSREVTLYRSLARSLSVNFSGLTRLQVLVEGRVVPTLGGHLDAGRPLVLSEWT